MPNHPQGRGPETETARSLAYALEKYPERVDMIPLEHLLADSARKTDKRPAYVKLHVPDEVVKGLRGSRQDGDLLLLVRVPRDILERQESRIILPGEIR